MKSVCIIASDNVVIDGDVVFNRSDKSGTELAYLVDIHLVNLTITNCLMANQWDKSFRFKLSLLWFWHMVVLRKSHVYLTGALR